MQRKSRASENPTSLHVDGRADIIIKGLNKAIDGIPTMSIGARVAPDSLKAISDTCDKFALGVANQLLAHRNKQLEQQKAHE